MGNHHNLFGDPNEAHIEILPDGSYKILDRIAGSCIRDMVAFARYDATTLADDYRKLLQGQVELGRISAVDADRLVEKYSQVAQMSTYLE